MSGELLVEKAVKAMSFSYSPYSGFRVGAAIKCLDGAVYSGCNVENPSFGLTICAERTAAVKAISDGNRKFCDLAVVGGKNGIIESDCPPCGMCLQFLSEFSDDLTIYLFDGKKITEKKLSELFPVSFSL